MYPQKSKSFSTSLHGKEVATYMKVLTILEISSIFLEKIEAGEFVTAFDIYGWKLRENKTGKDVRKVYSRANRYLLNMQGTNNKKHILGAYALHLLDVYKRDRSVPSDIPEKSLKSTVHNNYVYEKNDLYSV